MLDDRAINQLNRFLQFHKSMPRYTHTHIDRWTCMHIRCEVSIYIYRCMSVYVYRASRSRTHTRTRKCFSEHATWSRGMENKIDKKSAACF